MTKFAAFSCPHTPFHSENSLKFLLATIKDHNPDVIVCLGDLFDASSASKHPDKDEYDHDLVDEYLVGADYLRAVRGAGKSAQCVWCLGNHDDNIQKRDGRRIPKRLRRACHWNSQSCGDEFKNWKQVPYVKRRRGCFQLGQVIFAHGWSAGSNSDELEGIQLINEFGGIAHSLVVRGHTHRPKEVTQCHRTSKIPLNYWYANAGTMCDPEKLLYAERLDISQWKPAVVVGEVNVTKSPRVERQWDANVLIQDRS